MGTRKNIPLDAERISQLRASPVMKVADAVRIYQVSRSQLYNFMRDGGLTYVKVGTSRLVRTDSLEALVAAE
jgi:hypothetical protein